MSRETGIQVLRVSQIQYAPPRPRWHALRRDGTRCAAMARVAPRWPRRSFWLDGLLSMTRNTHHLVMHVYMLVDNTRHSRHSSIAILERKHTHQHQRNYPRPRAVRKKAFKSFLAHRCAPLRRVAHRCAFLSKSRNPRVSWAKCIH
jgi:hypothetical protein